MRSHQESNTETAGQNESANLSQEVAEETANMAESPSHKHHTQDIEQVEEWNFARLTNWQKRSAEQRRF